MLFNGFTYLVFLPVVVLLHWLLPKPFRKALLLAASYLFYMNWMPAYGLLIAALTLVNYGFGIFIADAKTQSRKKSLLITGIVLNLSCLCFFKYTNFIVGSGFESLKSVLPVFGMHTLDATSSPAFKILLPLGISFFTFEFIHYITDVFRGSAPMRNLPDFALFAAFFPTQIAGPIKRFQDFVEQLKKESKFSITNFQAGMFLILQGLFKKVALGDNLGALVNSGYANVHSLTIVDAWLTTVAFALQLFFDFAGYTDIGRGSALLLGYKVPENFNWPYLAPNPTEFWHRWHISLSTWLRDYLFIPLGGSRGSEWKTRRNMFLTMVLGGLWHGAAWTFVCWGVAHGLGLIISKGWRDFVSGKPWLAKLRPHPLWHWSGVIGTFIFWTLTGILFRASTWSEATTMTQGLFCNQLPQTAAASSLIGGKICLEFMQSTIPAALILYSVYCCARYLLSKTSNSPAPTLLFTLADWSNRSVPLKVASCLFVAVLIMGFAPSQVVPFIYFQF